MKSVTVSWDETEVTMAITSIAGIVRTHGPGPVPPAAGGPAQSR